MNSLLIDYPDLASQAWMWNPENYTSGSGQIKSWKGKCGHIWDAEIKNRTRGQGCPYCCNKKLLVGFNDLATTNPEIIEEVYNWNPQSICAGSSEKRKWKGKCGHIWEAVVKSRTNKNPCGCPYCSNKKLLVGFNDLITDSPKLALQAKGWNPQNYISSSNEKKLWVGECGHEWIASIKSRKKGSNCPYCSSVKVLKGFNDLLTKNPEISEECYGWNPEEYTAQSGAKKQFKCKKCSNIWETQIKSRTSCYYTGCPKCKISGFRYDVKSYLYLIEKNDLLKIGIGNNYSRRIESHISNGWKLLDMLKNLDGHIAKNMEYDILKKLQKNKIKMGFLVTKEKFNGYTECWSKEEYDVKEISFLLNQIN